MPVTLNNSLRNSLTYVPQYYTMLYMKRKLTAIRLDKTQLAALEKIAKREDRSTSWLIRKAIDEFLKTKGKREGRS
jgi:hypothetical protein